MNFKQFATLMLPLVPEDVVASSASTASTTISDGRRFSDADSLDAMILR